MTNRYGNFSITIDLIENNPDIIRQVMGECIILRAEHIYATRAIEYQAWSPKFELLDEVEPIPEYIIKVTTTSINREVIFSRRSDNELSKTSIKAGPAGTEDLRVGNRSKLWGL